MKVYIGIDWSENKHDICFLDETGEVLLVKQIAHTIAGFRQLDQARQSLGVGRQEVIIGLETAHNLLVDYLWDQGYAQIYVLPPAAVKSAPFNIGGNTWRFAVSNLQNGTVNVSLAPDANASGPVWVEWVNEAWTPDGS